MLKNDKVRAMTLGQFFDLMKGGMTPQKSKAIEEVLGVILAEAAEFYSDYQDGVTNFALGLGLTVVNAKGLDKDTAKNMADDMGSLAYYMLVDTTPGWSDDTVARLEVIMKTNPDFAAVTAE
jgi:hypothetical protein